jgi:hypothetical protein
MKTAMTDISPRDASVLALIAGHQLNKTQAEGLLHKAKSGPATRRIATALVQPKAKAGKADKKAAAAIRHWANTLSRKASA